MRRIESIVKLLHGKTPSGRIVILGLLPRVPLSDLAAAEAPGALQLREASAIAQDASPLAATVWILLFHCPSMISFVSSWGILEGCSTSMHPLRLDSHRPFL